MAKNKPKDWSDDDASEDAPAAAVAPPAPDSPQDAPAAAVVEAPDDPPADLKTALENLKTANEMPESNASQQQAKHTALTRAQKHYHRLAQGDVPQGGSNVSELKDVFAAQAAAARQVEIQNLCLQFPSVAAIVAENGELKKQLEAVKK